MGPEPELPQDVAAAEYRLTIDLFNSKEVPVGLRGPRVVIVPQGGDPIESRPRDIGTGRPSEVFGTYYSTLDVLNLPPRQYVHKDLKGSFDQDGASMLPSGNWSRIELVAEFPKRPLLGGKTYQETIAEL